MTLEEFLSTVRRSMRGLPLTMTIHGWGNETARRLLADLGRARERGDAIWIVMRKDRSDVVATERDEIVVLDCDEPPDRLLFQNLVVDIAFFCAGSRKELEDAETLTGRCSVLAAHHDGRQVKAMLDLGRENEIAVCTWRGADVSFLPPPSSPRRGSARPRRAQQSRKSASQGRRA